MQERKIKTEMFRKEEVFRVLALAEACRLPVLLIGVPGVAKTQTLIDYAAAKSGYDRKVARENTYVIELDEGTKSSDVKGRVNMKELLVNKDYKIDSPIADRKFVLINEVDKGSSAIRNTLLSVMREKALFLGHEVKRCKWEIFAGSCNEIPVDEVDSPFWDRFIIKMTVDRVPPRSVTKIWKGKKTTIKLNLPEQADFDSCKLNTKMMNTFASTVYKETSDRTISQLPLVTKGIKMIWDISDEEAIMRSCELVCPQKAGDLSNKLEDPQVVQIKTKIKEVTKIDDADYLMNFINEIENMISQFTAEDPGNNTQRGQELVAVLKDTMQKSPTCVRMIEDMKQKAQKFANVGESFSSDTKALPAAKQFENEEEDIPVTPAEEVEAETGGPF